MHPGNISASVTGRKFLDSLLSKLEKEAKVYLAPQTSH